MKPSPLKISEKMHDIFLSYATQDRERLRPLVGALEAQGWRVFWDHRSIKVADDWHDVVGKAIHECPVVIVALSEVSVKSQWVREESLIARNRGVLYPILLDDIPYPFGFNLIQSLDFSKWRGEADFPNLSELLEQLAVKLGASANPIERDNGIDGSYISSEAIYLNAERSSILDTSRNSYFKSKKIVVLGMLLLLVGGLLTTSVYLVTNLQLLVREGELDKKRLPQVPMLEPKLIEFADSSSLEPAMVEIPGGVFTMGCLVGRDDTEGHVCQDDAKPAHEVRVSHFFLAKTEVTVEQFNVFVADTNYKTTAEKHDACWSYDEKGEWIKAQGYFWRKPGFEQGANHPAVCLSWHDTQAYLNWLKDKTGKNYRLPSEAEWEYASRAGGDTAYFWGNTVGKGNTNCGGNRCGDDFPFTSPVGSFATNNFGLVDMHGNVWEWAEDCWHANYIGAPDTGKAWKDGNCSHRVLVSGQTAPFYPQQISTSILSFSLTGIKNNAHALSILQSR